MKPFQIEIITQETATIGFDELKKISLDYERKFETVSCCKNKVFTEGCKIKIFSDSEIQICNSCAFDLYEMIYINLKNLDNNSLCYLRIIDCELILNKAELNFVLQKFEKYISFLYKEHLSYDIFDDLSPIKEKLIQKNNKPISLSDDELEYYDSLSTGQKKEYILFKTFSKIKNCNKKKLFTHNDHNSSINKKDFQVYCMPHNIPCKSSEHNEYRESVMILVNPFIKDFRFSFCSDCLHNFGLTLLKLYSDSSVLEYSRANFKVEYIVSDVVCLISGTIEQQMYRIHIFNNVFVLSKEYYDLLTEAVICSAAFKELYYDDYSEFIRFNLLCEINEDIELRNQMLKEKQQAEVEAEKFAELQKELQEQSQIERESFIFQISDLKSEIEKLNKEKNSLERVIAVYQKEKHKRENKAEEQQRKLIQKEIQERKYFDTHILDCVKQRQGDYILALPKDRNALYSGILKVTKIKGFSCKTLYHGYEYSADAIIQTYRKDDPLCLAACSGCIKAINNGLRKVNPRDTYFYDSKKDLEIRYISNNDSHKCHSCGNKHKHCYYVRLCNVVFYLCEKCRTSWIGQLERVPFDLKNS